jgi:phage host-nuclease inhibitor protein Gam
MKTRNQKKTTIIINTVQFEEAMARYAEAEHREAEINKSIESSVTELVAEYEDELSCLTQGKNLAFDIVQAYCINNKESLFAKRRSIGTLYGIAGFRLGTPRLKTTKGSNWKKVLTQLKIALPDYVRTVEEPAKDMLLADRYKEHVAPLLISLGIEVVQDELFYIDAGKAA